MNIDEAKQKLRGSAAHSIREIIRVGGEVANVAVHLTTTTTPLGKVGAVIGVVNAVLGGSSLESRFDGYSVLHLPECLQGETFRVLWRAGRLVGGAEDGKEKIWTMDVDGVKLAWVRDGNESSPKGPWLIDCDEESACQVIGRSIWEVLGPRITLEIKRWGEDAELEEDVLGDCLPSKLSRDLVKQIGKYHAEGINRSVLLHGPPGTGKSFVLRELAKNLGGFSLRYPVKGWGAEALQHAVKILRPTTLIIDDICRDGGSSMLEAVESIKLTVPLVAVSANYTDKLDPAMRRPGRFDRSVLVTHLDADTFDEMTKGAADQDRLRELPAAYVNEYMLTRRVEGSDVASALLPALERLAEEINAAAAPDDVDVKAAKASE